MSRVVYYTAEGRITGVKSIQDGMEEANAAPGESWFLSDDPIDFFTQYAPGGVITARPSMGLDIGPLEFSVTESLSISDIPNGAVFFHPAGQETIESPEDSVVWESEVPGNFILRFELFPYQEVYLRVSVNPV